MNILYCGDKNIGDGVLLSVLSLTKHVQEPLHIYILTMRYAAGDKTYECLPRSFADALDRRVKAQNADSTVTWIDASMLFAAQPPTANLGTRFTPCCMLRLYADQIAALPDRILYLDNDVLCRADITDFYAQDMDGCELCGVLDHYGKWFFQKNLCKFDYLNSGVLLLNLAEIRKTGLFARCRDRCATKQMFMPDQSALNKLAARKKTAPRRYNEQRKLQKDTVLQHFTTSFRFLPWFHAVSVKPWQIDRMHGVLKLHEYDGLLSEYLSLKAAYEKGDHHG